MKLLKDISKISFDFENDIKNRSLKRFIFVFTELGSSFGALIIIACVTVISGVSVLYTFVPIYAFQLSIVEIIKIIIKRPRPITATPKNLWGVRMSKGSFPSGHTSNIFTMAFLISSFYNLNPAYTVLTFFIAGGIATSRMLLGKHYIIDILGGAILGILFSLIGSYLLLLIKGIV